MIIEEFFNYRTDLLNQSTDDQGFIQESLVLSEVLPSMLDAKLIDSEDSNSSYLISASDNFKVNAYCVNESGERLQLFLVDETSIDLLKTNTDLLISKKSDYENQFKRCTTFLNKALKGYLNDEIQDSSPARPLVSHISSSEGIHQFDVIEIFLVSLCATVSIQGASPQPKRIEFSDETMKISYSRDRKKKFKELIIKKRLIDLNFLFNALIAQGNREALVVNFSKLFGYPINAIKAADEQNFESYLCVLPATVLADLYKDFSTRLLEKNVRSFLQFHGVNKGIRETIRKEPEKFVAYNNGLTITATSAEINESSGQSKIISLTDFQIVNGGQTTATIYFTGKDGFDISKVKVMAKINIAKETSEEELEELISNISTYSNAQSKVSKVDLRSRNPQLVKIKSLSESVLTPTGKKWFFERAKGEFNTKLRISGSNKNRLTKEFPPERRFSKELMAKYYSSWGDQPHLVKKGGEKIFRYFIEKLTGEDDTNKRKKPIDVNRTFYEELISKIILFRTLEKIYGAGKNSLGQLRSAAVPYSLAVLYSITDGNKKGRPFDLLKIWLNEGLENDLEDFFKELLTLINDLIKDYSDSEDYGEYSKKVELWNRIKDCKEIESFVDSKLTSQILEKYCLTKDEEKNRTNQKNKVDIDFSDLNKSVIIYSNGSKYYKDIIKYSSEYLTESEIRKISNISIDLINKNILDSIKLKNEEEIIKKIMVNSPDIFSKIQQSGELKLIKSFDFIVKEYNKIRKNNKDYIVEFENLSNFAETIGAKYSSVYNLIGKQFKLNLPPDIKQLLFISESIDLILSKKNNY